MTNKKYILGTVTVIIITLGCFFKIAHWPFAGLLVTLGLLLLSLIFIPGAFISSFKNETNKKLKLLYILTPVVFSAICIAALFKIMHWPFSTVLLLIAIPLPFLLLLPFFILSYKNDSEINYRNFMPIMFFFAYMAAITALLAMGPSQNSIHNLSNTGKSYVERTTFLEAVCEQKLQLLASDTSISENLIKQMSRLNSDSKQIIGFIENLKFENAKYTVMPISENKLNIDGATNLDERINLSPEKMATLEAFVKKFQLQFSDLQKAQKSEVVQPDLNMLFGTGENYTANWQMQNKMLVQVFNDLSLLQFQIILANYFCLNK